MILSILTGLIVCSILLTTVSYNALYTMQHNNINKGMRFDLEQQAVKLMDNYTNLLLMTQQITPQGDIGNLVKQFLTEKDQYNRSVLSREISSSIGLVTFTNSNIGLITYYNIDENRAYFNNLPIRDNFSPEGLPLLSSYMEFNYQSPHISMCRVYNDQVVSVTREVDFMDGEKWIAYVEIKCNIDTDMSKLSSSTNMPYILALLDNDDRIRYTSSQSEFRIGSVMQLTDQSNPAPRFKWNATQSVYGYQVVLLVTSDNYDRVFRKWKNNMLLIFGVAVLIMSVIAMILFRLIYRPFRVFETEMDALGKGNMDSMVYRTGILEFDTLFDQFNSMKQRIQQLLIDVELKEKRKHQLEIEKLAYQINPHFLMNSLHSVHWLAKMSGQAQIDKIICTLNFLLRYNLGKSNETATLRTEIEVLKAYLELQHLKYDFNASIDIQEGEYLDKPVARFILQPLVENALCHGIDEHGNLEIHVGMEPSGEFVLINIKDDGKGMSPEILDKIRRQDDLDSRQLGCGIGLRYVRSMLESHYGDRASMEIISALNHGTEVTLKIPLDKEAVA